MSKNHFETLAAIDVSEHIEKKGKFSYLSWSWAVDQLRRHDPNATWEVVRFDGLPYMNTDCGYFVEVAVTSHDVTLSQIHPVLDNRNKPIKQPSSFDINTSIQRCLVKAIALHGLGLYIYAGEDLPTLPITPDQIGNIKTKVLELSKIRDASESKVFEALKVSDITKLTEDQGNEALKRLDSWLSQAKEV